MVAVTGKDRCLRVAPVGVAKEGLTHLSLAQAELNATKTAIE